MVPRLSADRRFSGSSIMTLLTRPSMTWIMTAPLSVISCSGMTAREMKYPSCLYRAVMRFARWFKTFRSVLRFIYSSKSGWSSLLVKTLMPVILISLRIKPS